MIELKNAAQVLERLHDKRPVLSLVAKISCQVEHLAGLLVVSKVKEQTTE